MNDSATQAAGIVAAIPKAVQGGASGTLLATALPLDLITMAVGLVGALWGLLHIPPEPGARRTPPRVFAMVIAGGFMAGIGMPVLVAGSTHYLPWLSSVPDRSLQLFAAFAIGAAPHVLPYLWRLYRAYKRGEA